MLSLRELFTQSRISKTRDWIDELENDLDISSNNREQGLDVLPINLIVKYQGDTIK